jgi:GMP synthase-like glutamine amidotransferase
MTTNSRPVLVIEHETNGSLDEMAAEFGPGRPVRVIRPFLGETLPDSDELAEHAGLIVLGGSMGAWDDGVAPWLPATRQLLAAAVQQAVPTLGICLGAQLLAAACGGTVERGPAGLELGLVRVRPLPGSDADPFFGAVARTLGPEPEAGWAVHQYHFDAVTELPEDAELLVTGDRYPHQGFRVGAAAWGVQYHPEVSTSGFTTWVEHGLSGGELEIDPEAVLAPVRAARSAQQAVAAAHARAFINVLNSPVTTSAQARS